MRGARRADRPQELQAGFSNADAFRPHDGASGRPPRRSDRLCDRASRSPKPN